MLPLRFALIFRFTLILLILAPITGAAQQPPTGNPSPEGLGRINFPNSCTPAAQPAFLRGIAQLHSFQYAAAEKAFAEVPLADPHCAMAYWGLAMSSYRQLWDGADEKALIKGRAYLEKIRKDWPSSKREREYIDAIRIIFGDNRHLGNERIA